MIPFMISDLIFFASKYGHLSGTVFRCMVFFSRLCDTFISYNSPGFISNILSFLNLPGPPRVVSHLCVRIAQHIRGN